MNRTRLAYSVAATLAVGFLIALALWPGNERFGYRPADRSERDSFVATLRGRTLSEAAPKLAASTDQADESPVLLYRALNEAWLAKKGRPFVVEEQGIGDCVSWGSKHAVDIHMAVLWKIGALPDWKESASEANYGGARVEARGIRFAGYQDGATGYDAAKWLKNWGVLYRQPYDLADLSTYSAARAKEWGAHGCGGRDDQGRLDEVARSHPIKDVAPCTSWEEAVTALKNGYPIFVCSNQGFSSDRDADGFAAPTKRWAHCMCFCGVRFDRPGLLCLNSWGPRWIRGPKWPPDQPDGSFWVDKKTADYMLKGGGFPTSDSYAVSGLDGFPWQKIDHQQWVEPARPSDATRKTERVETFDQAFIFFGQPL
jgi:hypothetical protein